MTTSAPLRSLLVLLSLLFLAHPARAVTWFVQVGSGGGATFSPATVNIAPGDTVQWNWVGNFHSVTSGTAPTPNGLFDSGVHNAGFSFAYAFPSAGSFPYFCTVHGAMMSGTVNVVAPTPAPTPTPCTDTFMAQSFDGVTAPALPSGWVTTNAQGGAPLWVTSTVTPDSSPNDAFIDDPSVVSDKRLETPSVTIPFDTGAPLQVSFRNYYSLEDSFDGAVLEIALSIQTGGAFVDVLSISGAAFVTGGYNSTISTSFGNPLGGRRAWSGNSGGYINTVVNLGNIQQFQGLKLRFRMGSDSSTSDLGWRVDGVTLQAPCGFQATPTPSPTPTPTVSPIPTASPSPSPTPSPSPSATPTQPPATPTPNPTPSPTPCGFIQFAQNFDGVTAPALPSGWVATNAQGGAPLWVTSTVSPDSAPNDAFIDDPSDVSDKRLDTPGIFIPFDIAPLLLSFRHSYALEPVEGGPEFYDGAVLEISIPGFAGGAFVDITTPGIGATFVTGGYNGTISTEWGNPLGGRMAWSQNSGGYIDTVVSFNGSIDGSTVKFRFRMSTDSSTSGVGWRVDNVKFTVGCNSTFPSPTPSPTSSPSPTPNPTPTPPPTLLTISGAVRNCASPAPTATPPANPPPPVLPPVPNVLMTLSGSSSGTTLTNGSGNYLFNNLPFAGSYTVTPSKAALPPGSAGINTVDVIAIQRHFLLISPIPAGCRLTAADVVVNGTVNTGDVVAEQRFYLGLTSGTGSCGQSSFSPVNRSYSPLFTNQFGQDYSMLILGDVASPFAN